MKPLVSFNGWIMGKIMHHLTNREGFRQIQGQMNSDGYKTLVQDAFGFRYEVTVKLAGRIQSLPDDPVELVKFESLSAYTPTLVNAGG